MASEKKPLEGMMSGVTSRQKVVGVVLVIIVIVIIWQVMQLFGGSSNPSPTITPTNKPTTVMSGNAPAARPTTQAMQMTANPTINPMPSNPAQANPQAPAMMNPGTDQMQLREAAVAMNKNLIDLQKETEQKYIEQLNQLQTLKIQREIAETNQAIASARLATVTAEKSASELLTTPTVAPAPPPPPAAPQPPASSYANALMGAPQNVPPPPPPEEAPEIQYVVISVSMQFGHWSAVLGNQGKLYTVSVGDVLPGDESKVISISKNGVTLERDKKKRKISIVSSI